MKLKTLWWLIRNPKHIRPYRMLTNRGEVDHTRSHELDKILNEEYEEPWERIDAVEKWAEGKEDVFIANCDDSHFMCAILVFVVTKNMGIGVTHIPQCGEKYVNFFLYEGHSKSVLTALKDARKYLFKTWGKNSAK